MGNKSKMVRDVRDAAYAYDLLETDPGAATERFFPSSAAVSLGDTVHSFTV
jgi:hypothetical protein